MSISRIDRTVITRGPAVVKFAGGTFFSKDDITLDWGITNQNVDSSAFGPILPWRQRVKPTLKMNLVGEIEDLNVLFPHASLKPGQSIFTAADVPLQICPIDNTQNKVVFAAAAVLEQPDLTLGIEGGGPALGAVTFAFIPKNNSLPTDADAWFTSVANDFDGNGLDPSKILIQGYSVRYLSNGTFIVTVGADSTAALAWNISAADLATALNALASVTADGGVTAIGDVDNGWTVTAVNANQAINFTGTPTGMPGGTTVRVDVTTAAAAGVHQVARLSLFPWANFPPEKAIKVSFKSNVAEQTGDGIGVYDMLYQSGTATAQLTPLNVSQAVMETAANLQGANAGLGSGQYAFAHTLRIYADGLYVELRGALITKAGLVYSPEKIRIPQIEFTASRTLKDNVLTDLFYIGTEAPE